MSAEENKVQFNLKNVHVVPFEITAGVPEWGDVIKIPGAVNLSLSPKGDVKPFYADGIVYYQSIANNGYNGDLEVAKYPDEVLKAIWKFKEDETDHVMIENSDVEPSTFALLFQIDGDKDNEYYCLYNCSATRPGITSKTNTETKEPETQKSTISAVPLENGNIMARTTAQTPSTVKANWFKQVYEPAAATPTNAEIPNTGN